MDTMRLNWLFTVEWIDTTLVDYRKLPSVMKNVQINVELCLVKSDYSQIVSTNSQLFTNLWIESKNLFRFKAQLETLGP